MRLPGNGVLDSLLATANLVEARWLLVAIPEVFEASAIVRFGRRANQDLIIIARAHFDEEVESLTGDGATVVIMGEREIAKGMVAYVLEGEARPGPNPYGTQAGAGRVRDRCGKGGLMAGATKGAEGRSSLPRYLCPAALALLVLGDTAFAIDSRTPALVPRIEALVAEGREQALTQLACLPESADADEAIRIRALWRDDIAFIVATLWAADFPPEFIAGIETWEDRAGPLPSPPDEATCLRLGSPLPADDPNRPRWRVWSALAAAGFDFGSAMIPPTPAAMARVKAVLAVAMSLEARALGCLALEDRAVAALVAEDWRKEMDAIRVILQNPGWPRDWIDEVTLPAYPEELATHPAALGLTPERCAADQSWIAWFYNFEWTSLRGDVTAAIASAEAR